MNTLYPIFLKVEKAPIVVVGGGKVAEQKVSGLVEAGASVTVIAPKLTEMLVRLHSEQRISVWKRKYYPGDLQSFSLVFAATNDPAVHKLVFDEASSLAIPVNVVDVPGLCNFYLASVFQKGDLKVAISTNGKSPTLGKIIRDRIGNEFGTGYPELLDTLGEIRPFVHSAFAGAEKRKDVLEKIVDDELQKLNLHDDGLHAPGHETISHTPHSGSGRHGRVFLVGAGPGDPDLITVKGLQALQQADVIVYDALVSKDLLGNAKSDCELIYAGKRSGQHSALQDEINAILLMKAVNGKSVVRLKGGDPFIFGRGAEEAEFLRSHGIDVRIIPGITAGTGIPSTLGIPLTHRGVSSSVIFMTGSDRSGKSLSPDWDTIVNLETIVVYMGIQNLASIVEGLTTAGRPAETPIAIIFDGTNENEIVIDGTLGTILSRTRRIHSDAPGIIIIGDVVRFFQSRPAAEPPQHQFSYSA